MTCSSRTTNDERRTTSRAFTFVELVVAATILAILTVGLATHLRGGVMVWRRTTELTDRLQRQRVALERLERDLANALVYDTRQDAYGSHEGGLPLPQFIGSTLAWYTVVPSSQGGAGVRYVTYACEELEGTQGLWRTVQTVGAARAKQVAPTPQLLLPGCGTLGIRIAYRPPQPATELEWLARWDDPLKLPRLLEVSLKLDSGATLTRILSAGSGLLQSLEEAGQT